MNFVFNSPKYFLSPRSLDKSGFDSTMVQSKGIGMVFDGEGLAYYYKDLEKASWWKPQQDNWNNALSKAITANAGYVRSMVSLFLIFSSKLLTINSYRS